MPSVNDFKKSWDKSGRPRTVDGIAQVLRDNGLSEEQMQQVFESQGLTYQSPLKQPDPAQGVQEPEKPLDIPVGFKLTTKTGKELEWKGAQWVSKGKIVPKKYRAQIDAAAQREYKRQLEQKKKAEDEAQRKIDSDYEFEDDDYEPQEAQAEQQDPDAHVEDMKKLQALSQKIKATPHSDKIAQLLGMNDPIADLAIKILMTGQAEKVLASLTNKSKS